MEEFENWLRTACFQKPTPEAYDLAKCAWAESRNMEREACAELFEGQYTDTCPGTKISDAIRKRSNK